MPYNPFLPIDGNNMEMARLNAMGTVNQQALQQYQQANSLLSQALQQYQQPQPNPQLLPSNPQRPPIGYVSDPPQTYTGYSQPPQTYYPMPFPSPVPNRPQPNPWQSLLGAGVGGAGLYNANRPFQGTPGPNPQAAFLNAQQAIAQRYRQYLGQQQYPPGTNGQQQYPPGTNGPQLYNGPSSPQPLGPSRYADVTSWKYPTSNQRPIAGKGGAYPSRGKGG